jgi:hypothetical protein
MAYAFPQQKLTRFQKTKNKNAWGKRILDEVDGYQHMSYGGKPDMERKRVNYDLFNGVLDMDDFEYVCKPYGQEMGGELPAELRHYDITTPKLRVLFGEEIKRPFNYKVVTTNSEAITEKERAKHKMIADYVKQQIMQRVNQMVASEAERMQGSVPPEAMNPQVQQQFQEQLDQMKKQLTPKEIDEYMKRDYLGDREIQAQQILDYLIKKQDLKYKFSKGWKHALIAGTEVYWVGTVNGEPEVRTVNPLYFDYDKDPDLDYIQDGQWAKYVMRMTASSVVDTFGEYLTDQQIKDLYSDMGTTASNHPIDETFGDFNYTVNEDSFNQFMDGYGGSHDDTVKYIRVMHCEWKSLRKIGFLKYLDENGVPQETIVDETYKYDEKKGDIELRFEWLPEVWEGTKIGTDVYVNIRPKPNQFKDLDNLYHCKLGYIGIAYNNLNAESISMVDRIKPFQYMYNIIMYRLELDLASDKGKKFLADINQIPSDLGMDMQKWLYYFDSLGIAFVNPHEEGNRGKPHSFNQWQAVDLSMAQTINQKIQLLEYLEAQSGEVAGVTKQREGQIGPREGLGVSQQAVIQSSHITEELFHHHDAVKSAVLEAMIDMCKVAWGSNTKKIQYVLDDMSVAMFSVDSEKFVNSSYGIFVSDSARDQETFMVLRQLAQAALQNQRAELSDVIKMFSTNSTAELKAILEKSEDQRRAQEQQARQQQLQSQERIAQSQNEIRQQELDLRRYDTDKDNDTKLRIAEMNNEKDLRGQDINNNQIPDALELSRLKQEEQKAMRKDEIEKRKLDIKERELDLKARQSS